MVAVLVMEPDRNQRLLLREELECEGYAVLAVATVGEALLALTREPVAVAVLEAGGAQQAGLEVLGLLASLRRRMPVVIYTGYARDGNEAIAGFADAYIVKRSDLSVLKHTVRLLLGARPAAAPAPLPAAEAAAAAAP